MSEQGRAAQVMYGAGACDCFQPKGKAGLYRLHFGWAIFRQTGPRPQTPKSDRVFAKPGTRGECQCSVDFTTVTSPCRCFRAEIASCISGSLAIDRSCANPSHTSLSC